MIKYFYSILLTLLLVFVSCAGTPKTIERTTPETASQTIPEIKPEAIPDTASPGAGERLAPPKYIMGKGYITDENMAAYLARNNPRINPAETRELAKYYVEEAAAEGVNHDIAFAQMCLETGFLRFGGDVKPWQNNFAGLGAIGNGEPGLAFPDPRTGVRAQIQHLKAYGSEDPLNGELVNPRFRFVRRGCAPTIDGLAGTWAADKSYSDKIASILQRLYEFAF